MRTSALAAVLLASSIHPANAAEHVVTAAASTFAPGSVSIGQGDTLTFANPDVAPHNVVADATTKAGPVFRSAVATTGQTAKVAGVEKLKPGTYPFYCSLHPTMRGVLTVAAAAPRTAVPTPTGASVPTPTAIAVRNGTVYVTSFAAGTVNALTILPGGGLAPSTPYATGFDSPLGLAFAPDGTLYVADSHDGPDRRLGRVWAVRPDGTKSVVVDGLPNGRHNTNNLAVHAGRLYVTNGNATDDGTGTPAEAPLSGTLLSYALPVTPRSKPAVEARGLRNVYDVAFRPGTHEAWFPTNGPDDMAPLGEDLLHRVDVRAGTADYGFPACVYGANPTVPKQSPAYRVKQCRPTARPVLSLGLHVSANGVAFGPGGAWGNDLYVAMYGSNDPSVAGHRVVRVPIGSDGSPGLPRDVVTSPSPLDLAFGPDGLYVADFATGTITLLRAT